MQLSEIHPHYLDDKIKFYEEEHEYIHVPSERKFPISVTGLVHRAFPNDFDADKTIEKYIVSWMCDVKSKYYLLIRYLNLVKGLSHAAIKKEIKALWEEEGREAREAGTAMHAALEDWMNSSSNLNPLYMYAVQPIEYALTSSIFGKMELKPYRSEFKVFLTEQVAHPSEPGIFYTIPILCGTIDAIFIDKLGRFWIFDWKRVDPAKKGLLGTIPPNRFAKQGLNHFWGFTHSDFRSYSLQLVLYKLILERGGYLNNGQEVAALYLCQMHPTLEKPHIVEALDNMSIHDQELFEQCANLELDNHIAECKKKEIERLGKLMSAEAEEETPNNTALPLEGSSSGMDLDF